MSDSTGVVSGRVSQNESAEITSCVANYCDGWLTADAGRMEAALHPELVKRAVESSRLITLSADDMVEGTREGGGSDAGADQRNWTIEALDVRGGVASAVVVSYFYVDYLHLGRFDGTWRIVNALWCRR
jgi:hypothetical protein